MSQCANANEVTRRCTTAKRLQAINNEPGKNGFVGYNEHPSLHEL